MGIPQNLLEVWNLYQQHIEMKNPPAQAKRTINEVQSAIMRILLRGLGYDQQPAGKKMTRAEVGAAKAFMASLNIDRLTTSRAAVEIGLGSLILSQASRNTYGGRLDQFLTWCEEQYWWKQIGLAETPGIINSKSLYCPRVRRGHGKARKNQLTERRTTYKTYQLQSKDITANLDAELQEFYHFLTDFDRYDRWMAAVSDSTAQTYVKHIRLMLGWFHLNGTPKKHLSLDLLIPNLREEVLEDLDSKQRETCWKIRKNYIDAWICKYFIFLREEANSKSPKTKRFKTHALMALGKFQYRSEVNSNSGYEKIPVLQTIRKYSNFVRKEVRQWNQHKQRVVPIDKKWPKLVEGQTALITVRKQVVEELRSFCKPKYSSNWHFRNGSAIASSLRDYLAWNAMTDMPARRQEEARSWRIALTCPVDRPEEVPYDGFYQPLPPDQVREKDNDNQVMDNYLYKTYIRKSKLYSEGIWVLDIQNYKTRKRYGRQSVLIKNRQFADGNSLYDYIERYLYGWWHPEENEKHSIYTWWNSSFIGQQGLWVSSGRFEFQPDSFSCEVDQDKLQFWSWGYFFITPRTGNSYNDSTFKDFFSTAAHKVIGQRITPHILRDMWATWSYQVGLTDAQRESLAYAMGMDIKTLENIYERCSPDEKRRPIEDVIDQLLFGELVLEYQQSEFYLEKLAQEILSLSNTEQSIYRNILSNQ